MSSVPQMISGAAQAITSRSYIRTLDADLDGAIADTKEAMAIARGLGAIDDQIYVGARQVGLLIASGRIEVAVRRLDEIEAIFHTSRGTPTWKVILVVQRVIVEDARGNREFVTAAVRQVQSMLDDLERRCACAPGRGFRCASRPGSCVVQGRGL